MRIIKVRLQKFVLFFLSNDSLNLINVHHHLAEGQPFNVMELYFLMVPLFFCVNLASSF